MKRTATRSSPREEAAVRVAPLTNAAIAHELATVAQLLSAGGENPFKAKAYRRAADTIRGLPESVYALVEADADLTELPGIGPGLAGAIRELVKTGRLRSAERLRTSVAPEVAALSEYPRLDPKRVAQIFNRLGIATVGELRAKLDAGEIGAALGPRMEQHVRDALIPSEAMLLYDADQVASDVVRYLLDHGADRVEVVGAVRRRVEVVPMLELLVATGDFAGLVNALEAFGGGSERVAADDLRASVRLPMGLLVTVQRAERRRWGIAQLIATGSEAHLTALQAAGHDVTALGARAGSVPTERAAYAVLGLPQIPPELREGWDEVVLAAAGRLPRLVAIGDIRGDLHVHTTASDGADSLEAMAAAARERGYAYLGIADHSQSLKIAGGLSEDALWEQIRRIDRLNEKLSGIRVLKSAEVDIRIDGTLDYPDALLRELDYTVCSIHSRFGLDPEKQTERVLRAMDNPHFKILGHATGRLLLRRPGYRIDVPRIIAHARDRGCGFEINASPDRLDLSAEHARLARVAGVRIAINTDAHSTRELDYMRCGLDVARRAGLAATEVLNTLSWTRLERALRRG